MLAASTCDGACRISVAHAVCSELLSLRGVAALSPAVNGSALVEADAFRPLLRARSALLLREFGCEVRDGLVVAPPMQAKSVSDGKSGSGFLVAGGHGVSPEAPASYSVLLKQLNPTEAALLPGLLPSLVRRFTSPSGSLLSQFVGWARYTFPTRNRVFEALLMDNVARPSPGISPASRSRWPPFDMKGIRLYKNERRFEDAFGRRGLRISAQTFRAISDALEADVSLLSSRQLVDYSFLLTVVAATPAPPAACGEPVHGWTDRSIHLDGRVRATPRPISACFCRNASTVARPPDGGGSGSGGVAKGRLGEGAGRALRAAAGGAVEVPREVYIQG